MFSIYRRVFYFIWPKHARYFECVLSHAFVVFTFLLFSKLTLSKFSFKYTTRVLYSRPNFSWIPTVCKVPDQQRTKSSSSLDDTQRSVVVILLDFSLTVKAAPHECVIRTSQS